MLRTQQRGGVGRGAATVVAALTLLAPLTGCQTGDSVIATHSDDPLVVIETADFGEVELVGAILSNALTREGYRVSLRSQAGTQEQVLDAVTSGDADLTVGFTGELLARHDRSSTARSSEEVYTAMMAALPEGVTAGDPAPAEDAPAYVVSRHTSETLGLRVMSDLAGRCGQLGLGARAEVLADTELSQQVGQAYDCSFGRREELPSNPREVARALESGRVGVGVVQSTDPVLSLPDMVRLTDDAEAITAQNLVPVFAKGSLSRGQLDLVNRIFGELTDEGLQELLRGVEYGTATPAALATYWLDEHGY